MERSQRYWKEKGVSVKSLEEVVRAIEKQELA